MATSLVPFSDPLWLVHHDGVLSAIGVKHFPASYPNKYLRPCSSNSSRSLLFSLSAYILTIGSVPDGLISIQASFPKRNFTPSMRLIFSIFRPPISVGSCASFSFNFAATSSSISLRCGLIRAYRRVVQAPSIALSNFCLARRLLRRPKGRLRCRPFPDNARVSKDQRILLIKNDLVFIYQFAYELETDRRFVKFQALSFATRSTKCDVATLRATPSVQPLLSAK